MDSNRFEELANEAAAGLRSDQELFLDVKQELQSHLEDKAEQFAGEGHDESEASELARKAFGSPVDVAAELVSANRRRMKLRSLARMACAAMVVPLAIVLALYMGYGRTARLTIFQSLSGQQPGVQLPSLPFAGTRDPKTTPVARLTANYVGAPEILGYWKAHRAEPNSRIFYAYYVLGLTSWPPSSPHQGQHEQQRADVYVAALREGERIESDNALYNVLLAVHFLSIGIRCADDKESHKSAPRPMDELLDRQAFEAGVKEMLKAAKKPYLRTYQSDVLELKLASLPRPVVTEDYIQRLTVASGEYMPQLALYRELARQITASARLLHKQGRNAESEAVMDTWRPYTLQIVQDFPTTLINVLVDHSVATILTKEGSSIYDQLGKHKKAEEVRRVYTKLKAVTDERRAFRAAHSGDRDPLKEHSGEIAGILIPVFGENYVTVEDLKPSRMQEHVLSEEIAIQCLILVLMLATIANAIQGWMWLRRLRGAASVPMLLLPPAKATLRALLLGIVVPFVLYWVYSRLPIIGGREFSLSSHMWPRFAAEIVLLMIIMFWVPSRIMRGYIKRRCSDLEIAVPTRRAEVRGGWTVFAGVVLAVTLGAAGTLFRSDVLVAVWGLFAAAILLATLRFTDLRRKTFGLYYGTLARSLAPVYAFSIILLCLVAQPWLFYNEAMWLHKDTMLYGQPTTDAAFTPIEARVAQRQTEELKAIVSGQEHR